jgi:hypothetical protein
MIDWNLSRLMLQQHGDQERLVLKGLTLKDRNKPSFYWRAQLLYCYILLTRDQEDCVALISFYG